MNINNQNSQSGKMGAWEQLWNTKLFVFLQSRLAINAGYLWGITIAGSLFGFIFWNLSTRFYTTQQVGTASAVISLSQLIVSIASLGIGIGLVRFYDTEDRQGIINTALSLTLITSVAAGFIFLSGTEFWSPSLVVLKETFPFIIFLVLIITTNHNQVLQMVFLAAKVTKFAFWQALLLNTLRIILLLPFLVFGWTGMIVSLTVATLMSNILGFFFLPRTVNSFRPRAYLSWEDLKLLVPYSVVNSVADFLYRLPTLISPILVINALGAKASAYTYIAMMISAMLLAPGIALSQSTFSEGSSSPKDLHVILKSGIYGVAATIILSVGVGFGAPLILGVFGKDYSLEATSLLRWLALAAPVSTVNFLLFSAFRVQKRLKVLISLNLISAIIFLLFTTLFINWLGLTAIGVSWFVGQGIVLILAILLYAKRR